jgi:predicted acyltransferase
MILVNNPGSWSHIYPPLRHAEWHGCTPTDLIFPFFLFIVGVSLAYALPKHLEAGRPGRAFFVRVLRRTVLLIALGLLLNAFAPMWRGLASGDAAVLAEQLRTVRLPGVLQRIGLVYLLACVMIALLRPRTLVVVCIAILVAHPLAMLIFNPAAPFTPDGNLSRAIDLAVFGADRLYAGSPTDPEGLLGTLPALVTTIMGYGYGLFIRGRAVTGPRCLCLIGAGVLLAGLGWGASWMVPFNKPLWSSSYTVYSAGWAAAGLGLCLLAFDRFKLPTRRAFALLGRHAITAFVGSGLLARIITLVPGPGDHATLKSWMISGPDAILSPKNASLGFAIGTVIFWWLIAKAMDRAGLAFKV